MNLNDYDLVLVNSSAGKDSQAMLDYLVELADAQGFDRGRLVVGHADLGRVEWAGTRELAERQAAHYGIRFVAVSRDQDLLDQVAQRGMWPSSSARYCTSDHKRDQLSKVMTALSKELRDAGHVGPVKILNAQGIRAAESPARAAKKSFQVNKRQTGKGTAKVVHDWFPIFDWSLADVWTRIKSSGVEHHRAYDLGMPRLSCVFCVFASRPALMLAGRENPELLDAYVAVENQTGHTFRQDLTLASVKADLDAGVEVRVEDIKTWEM